MANVFPGWQAKAASVTPHGNEERDDERQTAVAPSGTKALGANPKALVVSWDEQARQLGWTSRDLFGLDTPL